jgi:hypothetical protein
MAHEVTPTQLRTVIKHLPPASVPFFKKLFELVFGYAIDDLPNQPEDRQHERLTNCKLSL